MDEEGRGLLKIMCIFQIAHVNIENTTYMEMNTEYKTLLNSGAWPKYGYGCDHKRSGT